MTKTSKTLLLTALMTSVAAGAFVVKHNSEQSVMRSLAAANVTASTVSANLLTGTIRLGDVHAGLGADRVHVGNVILHTAPLSLISAAHARSGDDVTFEDVAADLGPYHIDIPEIVVAGSDMNEAAIGAMFDPKGAGSLSDRVARLNANTAETEEMTITSKNGDVTLETTYSNVKASGIVNGKIARLIIESTEETMEGQKKNNFSSTTGEIVGVNISLPGNFHILAEAAKPDEALAIVADSYLAKEIELTIEDDKGEGTLIKADTLSYGQIKGRPLNNSLAEAFKSISESIQSDSHPDPKTNITTLPVVGDVFKAFEFSAEVKDITFSPLNDKPGPHGKLARIAITDFGKGGIGAVSMDGLAVQSKDGHVNLGSAAIKGLTLSPFLDALTEAAKSNYKDFNPRAVTPTVSQVGFADVDIDVLATDGKGNSADGKNIKLGLGKFELNLTNYIGGLPATSNAVLEHITFDLPKNSSDESVKTLMSYGIDKIDSSSKLDWAYSDTAQELSIKELSINGAGLGMLKISGIIGNVSKDVFNSNTSTATAAALAAVVKSLDIRLENTGIIDKLIAKQAQNEGKSIDDVRKEYVGVAAVGIPAAIGSDAPATKIMANAVSKFIADPKNLHISARSKDGIGAGDLGLIKTPDDLLKKIDVTAGANE